MSYKIPVYKIITDTISTAWVNRGKYLKAISAPTLVLVIIVAVWNIFPKLLGGYTDWIVWLVYGLGFSLFAVTCHRLILVSGEDKYKGFNVKFSTREFIFLAWLASIYALVKILEAIPFTIVLNLSDSINPGDSDNKLYWVKLPFSIPALYVLGRLSLIFPATAVDKKVSLGWSWRVTKNNGWRMFIVVGLFPWLLTIIIWLMWREHATALEKVILTIVSYFGYAIGIFALSLTYREFENYYKNESERSEVIR